MKAFFFFILSGFVGGREGEGGCVCIPYHCYFSFAVHFFYMTDAAIAAAMVMLLISGMVTTVTFTFMMQCSRGAHTSIQATHYTILATVEVFGTSINISAWHFSLNFNTITYSVIKYLFDTLPLPAFPISHKKSKIES